MVSEKGMGAARKATQTAIDWYPDWALVYEFFVNLLVRFLPEVA